MSSFCVVVRYQKYGRDAEEHHETLMVEARDLLEAYRVGKLACEGRGYGRFQIFNVQESEVRWMSAAGTRNSRVKMPRSE